MSTNRRSRNLWNPLRTRKAHRTASPRLRRGSMRHTPRPSATSRTARLRLEQLEDRRLLSIDLYGGLGPFPAASYASSSDLSGTPESAIANTSLQTVNLEQGPAVADQIIVRFADEAAAAASTQTVSALGGSVISQLGIINGAVVQLDEGSDIAEAVARFSAHPAVMYAEPDYIVHTLQTVPDDPRFGELWGLHNTGQSGGTADADIDAPEAWDTFTGSSSVVVAVIDTGVDYGHEDLNDNMWVNVAERDGTSGVDDDLNGYVDDLYGIDAVNGDTNPMDDHSHGTHCAGTIGAEGDNAVGVAGVNWDVQIMALKFLNSGGSGPTSAAIECIDYMTMMKRDYGVNVVASSNSWGGGGDDQSLYDAIQASNDQGIMFLAAAGNGGLDGIGDDNDLVPFYPASYDLDGIIAVAATDRNDYLAGFSNYGATSVDLGAPGVSILSTVPGGGYGTKSGTSMATPHVAGATAFLMARAPGASLAEIKQILLDTGDPLPDLAGYTVSGNRLNLDAALDGLGMSVTGSSPAAGEVVTTPPLEFAIDFSDPYDPASVDPADLTLNSTYPADEINWAASDADTVVFTYYTSPVSADGVQQMDIAEGAVERAGDNDPVSAWTAEFRYDTLPMEVTHTVPADGSAVSLPFTGFEVHLNEDVDPASIDPGDVAPSQGSVAGAAPGAAPNIVVYTLDGLTDEGVFTFEMPAGALTDANGNPMLSYSGTFFLDFDTVPYPTPLAPKMPAGGLIYDPSVAGSISYSGDVDQFTVELDAGQAASVVVDPDASLRPTVELSGPGGPLGSATSGGPGEDAVLQTVEAAAPGTYTISVSGGGTTGSYTAQLVLNAAVELESHDGPANDDVGSAELLAESGFIPLAGGAAARAAVLGVGDPGDDFYGFDLTAGQSATLALAAGGAQGAVLELYGAGSDLLAVANGAGDLDRVINNFVAPATATYYARVAVGSTDYSLVVARDADFETGAGTDFDSAQLISPTETVLGAVAVEPGWTLMVYLDADNNLESAGIEDFLEMSSIGSTEDVHVVVQFDRISGYDTSYGDWTGTRRGLVAPGDVPDAAWGTDLGEVNMGDPSSVIDFVDWAISAYPASNYGLVLWDHGGGFYGVCFDDTDVDDLSMADLATVLDGVAPLDLLGYDACLMAMAEIAYQARGDADVMVGSEETEPGDGWEYQYFLDDLVADPGMDAAALAGHVIDAYEQRYGLYTLSAVDVSQAEPLAAALDDFADLMLTSASASDWSAVQAARDASQGYAYDTFRDLDDFMGRVEIAAVDPAIAAAAGDTRAALATAVLDAYAGGMVGTGLSIYLPGVGDGLSSTYNDDLDFVADTQWENFLAELIVVHSPAGGTWAPTNPTVENSAYWEAVPRGSLPDVFPAGSPGDASGAGAATSASGDWYALSVNAGDALVLQTTTPADGPGEFVNLLDPAFELYDPTGTMVDSDDNGAGDGHNARLEHTASLTGIYRVRVFSMGEQGEYVLHAGGATGDLPPFEVVASDPADGERVAGDPATVTVDFNDQVRVDSLDAGDLTIDGVPAQDVAPVDDDTVTFTLPGGLSEGWHEARIGGALQVVQDLQGTLLEEAVWQFYADLTAPVVVSSSIQEDDVLGAGDLVYTAAFSETLRNDTQLESTDVELLGQLSGPHAPVLFGYEPGTSTLSLQFAGLPEDSYTLTLLSGDGQFEDAVGHDLDGDPVAWPIPPNQSGDGAAGGDFVVHFEADVDVAPYPVPLEPKDPLGSLIYDPPVIGAIGTPGDTDSYTVTLDAGQAVTVVVDPDASLRPTVELVGPGGTLGTATAGAPGEDAVLQTVEAATAGVYTITLGGDGVTTGAYEARLVLNAAVEAESHDGPSNDDVGSAELLAESGFVALAGGTASRAAVLGSSDPGGAFHDSQTQNDVYSPNVLTYDFPTAIPPQGDGTLDVSAIADLDLTSEYLTLDAEGVFSVDLFVDDGLQMQPVSTSLVIAQADLAALAADGMITFTVTPSSDVTNLSGTEELTLELDYLGPAAAGDFFAFDLTAGQSATLALTTAGDAIAVLELYDPGGTSLALGIVAGNLDQVISDFLAPVTGTYVARVAAADLDYGLVITRQADFDTEPNDDLDTAQALSGAQAALGYLSGASPGAGAAAGSQAQDVAPNAPAPAKSATAHDTSHADAAPEAAAEYVPGRLIVRFAEALAGDARKQLIAQNKGTVVKQLPLIDAAVIELPDPQADVPGAAAAWSALPGVLYAQPDFLVHTLETFPTDPRFGELWAMHNTGQSGGTPDADIDAPEAWDVFTGSRDVVVAVIDTGVDYTHVELDDNMWFNVAERDGTTGVDDDGNGYVDDVYGIDAVNGDTNPMDDHGHGTHCSGTIGAEANNGEGVAGVNWDVQIMALKFLSSSGSGPTSAAVECVQYMTMMKRDYGVNVVASNNSWGGGGYDQALYDAIQASNDEGIMFVAAAGNDGTDNDVTPHYPSNYDLDGLIAVTATDHNDDQWYNYGTTSVDIGAPGRAILSTLPGNGYASWNGTSMATPHVTGATALLMAHAPGATLDQVKQVLLQSSDKIPSLAGKCVSEGRLNLANALAMMGDPGDYYRVEVNAGDELTISTSTPADGPGEFVNLLDPALELYDPDGNLVASNDNSPPDGRNANVAHTAAMTGTYTVRVLSAAEAGEYVLHVAGATGALPPFQVAATDPADGERFAAAPTQFTVDFDDLLLLTTVDASDLEIAGPGGPYTASAVTAVDGDTLAFDLPSLGDGQYTLTIAVGAIEDVQGTPLEPFSGTLVVDLFGPRVETSSILDGDTLNMLPGGELLYTATFDEELADVLGPDDVELIGALSGPWTAADEDFLYDPVTSTLTVRYWGLPEDDYTLTLLHGDGRFEDLVGNDLDGAPSFPLPSGDGTFGDDFVVHFGVDVVQVGAGPFERLNPTGSLMSRTAAQGGLINHAGDQDGYTLFGHEGETLWAEVTPDDPAVTLSIELAGVGGPYVAPAPGEPARLPLSDISSDGQYEVLVAHSAGPDGGAYQLRMGKNYLPELDDTSEAAPRAIDESLFDLGSGRYGVVGRSVLPSTPQSLVWGVQAQTRRIVLLDPTSGLVLHSFDAPDALTPNHSQIGLTMAEGGSALLYVNSDVDPTALYRLDPATGAVLSVETTDGLSYDGLGFDRVLPLGPTETFYSATMDSDPGWSYEGEWAWGQPAGGGSHNADPGSGYTGNNVVGYDLAGDYSNNMPVYYATTGAIDASQYTDVSLSFYRWLGVESASWDHANVQVSNDGTSWTTVWEHTGSAISDSAWQQQTHDVSAVADGQPTVYVRWGMGPTDSSVTYPGWNLDDVELSGTRTTDPAIFLNHDGVEVRRRMTYAGPEATHLTAVTSGAVGGDGAGRQFVYVPDIEILEFDPESAGTVLATLAAPAAGIEGMAFDGTDLYAYSTTTALLYTLDPDDGSVQDSMPVVGGHLFGLGAATGSGLTLDLPDVDVYTLDLTGKAGQLIDVVLAGQEGADFSGSLLELLDPAGTTVRTAVPDPLGVAAENYDLAILDFEVPADGVYTLRLSSVAEGEYGLLVTEGLIFDSEPNDEPDDPAQPVRSLDGVGAALGYLGSGGGTPLLFGIDWMDPTPVSVLTIDPADASLLTTYPAPQTPATNPFGLNLAFDGTHLWFNAGALFGTNAVYQLDAQTGATVASHTASSSSAGYGLAYLGGELFYSDETEIDVYSALDFSFQRSIPFPSGVLGLEGIAGDDAEGVLYGVAQTNNTLYRLDPATGAVLASQPASPLGNEQGMAVMGDELFVAETSGLGGLNELAVYDKSTMTLLRRMPVTVTNMIAGLGGDGVPAGFAPSGASAAAASDGDLYEITLQAGEVLVAYTQTPLDDPSGSPLNDLDPGLTLYDSTGASVASDGNTEDGKNARLIYTAPVAGVYRIEVASEQDGGGPYVLKTDVLAQAEPLLYVDDVEVIEGDANTTLATFDVRLVGTHGPVDVELSTFDGTEFVTLNGPATTADGDYVPLAGQPVSFPAGGDMVEQVSVVVNGDVDIEAREDFFARLSGPSGAVLADPHAVGTILNDDTRIALDQAVLEQIEGDTGTTLWSFPLSLAVPADVPVTLQVDTADGTAEASDLDYVPLSGYVLTFDPGEMAKPLTVEVLGDTQIEPHQTFYVDLSNASQPFAGGGPTVRATAAILNDDTEIAIDDVALPEGDAGLTAFPFTVSLAAESALPVTVEVSTADQTATVQDGDYLPIAAVPVTFDPGELSQTVTVWVAGDQDPEGDETFRVWLNHASQPIVDAMGVGTIQEDDAPSAEVVARHVFYNNSKWDESPGHAGGDPAANEYDDNAIAPAKFALLPNETATFENYTSYSKGLNGIMIDIGGLAHGEDLTAADFVFRMGNDDSPAAWPLAPTPSGEDITVRPGEGVDGSDRVTIIWPDYNTASPDPTTQAVAKQWLQVTVLDTSNTGLAVPAVFYFGNALGDSGTGNFGGMAVVNAVDSGAVRDNPHNPFINPAPLDDFVDFNRDQWVNAVDFGFVRDNATNPSTALKLITAPPTAPPPGPEETLPAAPIGRAALHDAAVAELAGSLESLAVSEIYLPEPSWLDASDFPASQGRCWKAVDPTRAAVEKLLATL